MDEQSKKHKNSKMKYILMSYIGILTVMILISFFKNTQPFNFNTGLITVMLIVTLLVMSESFDKLSLGKLISLSREVEKKDNEIKDTKNENKELRDKIVSLVGMVSNQHQSNNTILGFSSELLKNVGVVQSTEPKQEEENGESLENENESKTTDVPPPPLSEASNLITRPPYRKIEKEALTRFIMDQHIPAIDLVREVEFSAAFSDLDPIGASKVIFDAYFKTSNKEYFIEVLIQLTTSPSPMFRYKLYTLLAKLFFYRQAKNSSVELILVVANLPDSYKQRTRIGGWESFLQYFQPAIANGLLRVETIDFSEDDMENFNHSN